MWIADGWKDYELLDCGGGEKLERWGDQILVRPDPQAIWETPRKNRGWRAANARYSRSSTGGGHWDKNKLPESWPIAYKDLTLPGQAHELQAHGPVPGAGGQLGLCHGPDPPGGPAHPRAEPVRLHRRGHGGLRRRRGQRLPCGRRQGHGGLGQGERPALRPGGCAPSAGSWTTAPSSWSGRSAGARRYDAIIMDPPSYGRGPGGEVWKLEENLYRLCEARAPGCCPTSPLFVIINSYTTGLAPSVLGYHSAACWWPSSFGGTRRRADELGLPVHANPAWCCPAEPPAAGSRRLRYSQKRTIAYAANDQD